jgi:hypothetical protein
MRIETLSGVRLSAVALALSLQFNPAWAGVPEAMESSDDVPAGSLSPDEYQVNADGMKEDPNAKMSDVARAYRNGYINRGKQDQADYNAMIDSHNHGQRQPARQQVARVDVPPLPPGVPDDDNPNYTTVPPQQQLQPQPRPYVQRQVPQPQYRQVYQQPQYAPAAPMQYQQAPEFVQAPTFDDDSQPMYVQQAYAPPPPPPVQYVPVYTQPQYVEAPVVQTIVAQPVPYQVYNPYWGAPRVYAYRAPMVSYRMWR